MGNQQGKLDEGCPQRPDFLIVLHKFMVEEKRGTHLCELKIWSALTRDCEDTLAVSPAQLRALVNKFYSYYKLDKEVSIIEFAHSSGIYKIKNTVNGKCYIGQAQDINRRIKAHIRLLRSGTHYNEHLQKAWNKYGEESFEFSVITECEKSELDDMEMMFIEKFAAYQHGYNKGIGGGSNRGWKHSEHTKQKMREHHYDCSGKNNPMYGVSVYDILSPDEIASMNSKKSAASTGINNPFYGKHHTDSTKAAISAANKGRLIGDRHPNFGVNLPQDRKDKLIRCLEEWRDGRKHAEMPCAQKVVCLNNDEVFGSIIDAAENIIFVPQVYLNAAPGSTILPV